VVRRGLRGVGSDHVLTSVVELSQKPMTSLETTIAPCDLPERR
jgi:hypothetical protein